MRDLKGELFDARAKCQVYKNHVERIEGEIFKSETLPLMKRNIGRAFKYRNHYSCPSAPSDYWWSYFKIVGIKDDEYEAISFQIDSRGVISFDPVEWAFRSDAGKIRDSYIPVPNREFSRAAKAAIKAASKIVGIAK